MNDIIVWLFVACCCFGLGIFVGAFNERYENEHNPNRIFQNFMREELAKMSENNNSTEV